MSWPGLSWAGGNIASTQIWNISLVSGPVRHHCTTQETKYSTSGIVTQAMPMKSM